MAPKQIDNPYEKLNVKFMFKIACGNMENIFNLLSPRSSCPNLTIHMKNWMWKLENPPETMNLEYMHEKLDEKDWKVH